MIDLSLVEALFSVQVTIGVVIFALMPLIEDASRMETPRRPFPRLMLVYQTMSLSSLLSLSTTIDAVYLIVGYVFNVDTGLVGIFQNYGDVSLGLSIAYYLLPLVSLFLTLGMVASIVSMGYQILDAGGAVKGEFPTQKSPSNTRQDK